MRHPSEYSTVPFRGLHFMRVDAGTIITDERTGDEYTITDESFAVKGSVIFCTKKIFDRLKREMDNASD